MKRYIVTNSDKSKFLKTIAYRNNRRYAHQDTKKIFVDNVLEADVFFSYESAKFVADRVEGIVEVQDTLIGHMVTIKGYSRSSNQYLLKVGKRYLKQPIKGSIQDEDPVTTEIKSEATKLSFEDAIQNMRKILNHYPSMMVTFDLE